MSKLRNANLLLRVFMRRIVLLSIVTLTLSHSVFGQDDNAPRRGSRIIDDTTRQVYGPTTSKYYFEQDVFFNRKMLHTIDTAIWNFHRFNYVQRYENLYQDLGNIGTAIRPIYYQAPAIIGFTSGFDSYDMYWDTEQVKYFDTKSPYSNMKVIIGGKGRSLTKATYSRNINPNWNFGFTYRGLFIDKQILRRGKGDRNVKSNYYDLYTAYQTKDSTYTLFFNFRRNRMQVDENGGVQLPSDGTLADLFSDDARPNLTDAESRELRTNIHLYHQYQIGKALQLYHIMDRYRQSNQFFDVPASAPTGFYDYDEVDSTKTADRATFHSFRNEVGVKGTLLKLFYNGYYAVRQYDMDYKYMAGDTVLVPTKAVEHYLGGRISLKLDSLIEVTGWAELLQTGNYRIEGTIRSKWFEASIRQSQSAPALLYQAYRGSHDAWNNDFDDIETSRINGYLHYRSRIFNLSPGLTFTRIRNYVFFKKGDFEQDQTVLPVQTSGNQIIASPEVRLSLTVLCHITLSGRVIYTNVLENADNAIRVPEWFMNGQFAYANIFFNGNCDLQTGVDVHWKSAYTPLGYDLVIQKFYNQDTFVAPEFPIVDLFVNVKIKRGRIFFKYNNFMMLLDGTQGYVPTPGYPGQQNTFDFGFDWSFYD